MASIVKSSIEYFADPTKGRPVASGFVYVGIVDLNPKVVTNQKQMSVIQEDGSTVEVSQPLSLSAGGVPVYSGGYVTIVVDGDYSLRVDDKHGDQVYYIPKSSALAGDDVIATIDTIQDLIDSDLHLLAKSVKVLGYNTKGDGGGGPTRYLSDVASPGTYVGNGINIILPDGGDGSIAWLFSEDIIKSEWAGVFPGVITGTLATNLSAINATKKIQFGFGDYIFDQEFEVFTTVQGIGIGRTRLIFDCSVLAINGIVFKQPGTQQEAKISELSIACKDANGATAISYDGLYFEIFNKIVIENVMIEDEDGPNKTVAGFLTTYAWEYGVNIGDLQGLSVRNLFVYGNYDITTIDSGQFVSTAFRCHSTETLLFPRVDGLWINGMRTGFIVADKSFLFLENVDIARAYNGFECITADNYSEVFLKDIAVNAQNIGYNIDGITRLFLENSFASRHSSGYDGTQEWIGYNITNMQKSFISSAEAQPDFNATQDQTGFIFTECGDTYISNLTPGDNLEIGVSIDNSSNITGNVTNANLSGTILELKNNARVVNVTLNASESFSGTWWTEDGSLDLRNIQIDITNTTTYGLSSSKKFVERIAIIDKDNLGGTDEGLSFVCESGDLRIKLISNSAESNAILLNRTAGVFDNIDFRCPQIKLNNGPSWNVGSGSPEGVLSANIGSIYSRTNGGTGTSLYVKEGGATGNTGWVAK